MSDFPNIYGALDDFQKRVNDRIAESHREGVRNVFESIRSSNNSAASLLHPSYVLDCGEPGEVIAIPVTMFGDQAKRFVALSKKYADQAKEITPDHRKQRKLYAIFIADFYQHIATSLRDGEHDMKVIDVFLDDKENGE